MTTVTEDAQLAAEIERYRLRSEAHWSVPCACGHRRDEHYISPICSCGSCDCEAYRLVKGDDAH